jgi:hypothetical protein
VKSLTKLRVLSVPSNKSSIGYWFTVRLDREIKSCVFPTKALSGHEYAWDLREVEVPLHSMWGQNFFGSIGVLLRQPLIIGSVLELGIVPRQVQGTSPFIVAELSSKRGRRSVRLWPKGVWVWLPPAIS